MNFLDVWELKEFYYSCRRLFTTRKIKKNNPFWDGGYDRFGKKHKNVWEKLLQFLNSKNVDHTRYIASQFLLSLDNVVLPTHLYSEKRWEKYLAYQDRLKEQIPVQFNEELEILIRYYGFWRKRSNTFSSAIKMVFDTAPVSPLFKFLIAQETNLRKLGEGVLLDAKLQYLQAPELYNEYWSPRLESLLCQF